MEKMRAPASKFLFFSVISVFFCNGKEASASEPKQFVFKKVSVKVNVSVAAGILIIFVHSNFFCIFAHCYLWTTIRIMANISLNDK